MFKTEEMEINLGPQHPSTHGVLRVKLHLDGETVTRCTPIIGYLHRGVEKICEDKTFFQGQVWTDRTDYVAAISNNRSRSATEPGGTSARLTNMRGK